MTSIKLIRVLVSRQIIFSTLLTVLLCSMVFGVSAQEGLEETTTQANETIMAPIIIDGRWVGQLRGVS